MTNFSSISAWLFLNFSGCGLIINLILKHLNFIPHPKSFKMKKLVVICSFILFNSFLSAQDYDHYFMNWSYNDIEYRGLLAVNRTKNSAVLRVKYYNPYFGEYLIVQQNFQFSWDIDTGYWFLRNTRIIDIPSLKRPWWYAPDEFYFVENYLGFIGQIWNCDAQGQLSLVNCQFLNYQQLDAIKPYFYP